MGAIHRPYDRHIICPPHAKLDDVDSLLLQEGQIAIYDLEGDAGENGLKAVTNFDGARRDEQRYVMRIGRNAIPHSRISDDKAYSTPAFSLDEIIEVYASAPKAAEIKVDEVIFGYNGIDDNTAIQANKGDRIPIEIRLSGRPFELRNYPNGEVVINDYIDIERCPADQTLGPCGECDPCEAVDLLPAILKTIERIKNQPIAGGAKVGDFVEIKPIHSCDAAEKQPVEEAMNFYCMEMCDTGDAYALMQLKAAYPGLDIKRVDRKLSISKYQVMKEGAAPEAYEQKLASIVKGCGECPDGYDENKGGIIYAVTLEDEGADQSSVVEGLANAVATTASKISSENGKTGIYTVVVSKKPTKAEIEAFAKTNIGATVTYVTTTTDFCSKEATNTVEWTACGSCKISKDAYEITLPDNECGESALEELREAYPDLDIDDYGTPAGCQRKFKTVVVTDMVCDECDPIFKDFYVSKAPAPYRGRNWKKLGAVAGDGQIIADPLPKNCKCGILFRGIDYMLSPSDCFVDKMTFTEGSVRIAVQGGYPDEQREAISTYFDPIHTEYKSRWEPRTHLGANLLDKERESSMFFDNRVIDACPVARAFKNEETRLDFLTQYADFSFTIQPKRYSNAFGRQMDEHISFHFHVPYGAHEGIQALMDLLASAANIKPCKI